MLNYNRYGKGPPLILIHGVGLDRSSWNPLRNHLSAHREVIAIDLPGHGESPPISDNMEYDVSGYTKTVRKFIRHLGLNRPHIAGNSLGASITLELAASGDARSATALSPIGFWNSTEIYYSIISLRLARAMARALQPIVDPLLSVSLMRALLLSQLCAHASKLGPDVARSIVETFSTTKALPLTLSLTKHYHFSAALDPETPVTIAWGTHDRLLLSAQGRRAKTALPQTTKHVWLDDCGHVPMYDNPSLVATTLLNNSTV